MRTKDLDSLLQLLHVSGRSGILTVEPPGLSEGEIWQGEFFLTQGNISSCVVRRKRDGRTLLQGVEALRWLTAQGRLDWWMEEQAISAGSSGSSMSNSGLPLPVQRVTPVAPPSASVPRRTSLGFQKSMSEGWSREHYHVFALVDGKRKSEEIAKMLGRSPEVIGRVLQDLFAAGLIE